MDSEIKYGFTGDTLNYKGVVLHRIIALKDFGDVTKGTIGGWIESERNLEQEGKGWIEKQAKVYEGACVINDARVSGMATVYGKAKICERGYVAGKASVFDMAEVGGHAKVLGSSEVREYGLVNGEAHILDSAVVRGMARIYGSAFICGKADIDGYTFIYGHSIVEGIAYICGNKGPIRIYGQTRIGDFAKIKCSDDFISIDNIGSRNDTVTFFKDVNNGIRVITGCFHGTITEFEKRVKAEHGANKYGKVYKAAIALCRAKIGGR